MLLKPGQIAITKLKNKVISTIQLPYPEGKYKYETMMYDPETNEFDDYQQRYTTEEMALSGHIAASHSYLNKHKESNMGRITAEAFTELDVPLLKQITYHLSTNFYPPIPSFMAQTCVDAINAYLEKETNRLIDMPEGVSYKGSPSAPAWAIVEQHRLDSWLDSEEDYE